MSQKENSEVTAYSIYNVEQKKRTKINPLEDIYPKLPEKKYQVIYADPPWDYGGKMQYDKSTIKDENVGFEKKIFLSSASFKYPTVKLKQLKELDVNSIAADDCILFMWTTGPQMANSIELGEAWGFEYKTVAFVWDKMVHNPGRYTLSQTEFVLAFNCESTAEYYNRSVLSDVDETTAACDLRTELGYVDVTMAIALSKTKESDIKTAAIIEVELEALMKDCIRVSCNTEVSA